MTPRVESPSLGGTLTESVEPLSLSDAEALALRAYGLRGKASLLSSERDQNFLIVARGGEAHVLKVTHPAEDSAVTDFQTQIQLHLMHSPLAPPVPHLVPTLESGAVHWHETKTVERRAVRLITFMNGVPMVRTHTSPGQRRALGVALARFDQALEGFTHAQANHVLLWDLQHSERLREWLPFVEDAGRQALARRFMDRFVDHVRPRLNNLRRQVIHNDLNKYNVLVDAHQPDLITGILDFGDMVSAPLVQDLAVACAYQLDDSPNPLLGAAHCAAGYHATNPLTLEELELLPDLIAARFLVTVLITGWRATQYPANSEYILRNNPLSWRGLEHMAGLGECESRAVILDACQMTPRNLR